MTIDEAIAHESEVAKEIYVEAMLCHANPDDGELDDCIQRGKYHEQLADCLEELKIYRESSYGELHDMIYNKAIDDFERIMCEELKDYIDHKDYMCVGLSLHKFTRDLAEKLKVGGENE